MHREYNKWYSPNLQRDMELLVFGQCGSQALVFPTRAGRFYDYEDWGLVKTLSSKITSGELQLFCVDSIDAETFYCNSISPAERIARHLCYEDYLLDEILPFMEEQNPVATRIAHGCSMGAFHAVNLAFRHPHLFSKVVALSGRYDLTTSTAHFRDLFDGYYDETIYFHTPAHFIPNLTDATILARIRAQEIILAIGEDDQFIEGNRAFSNALHCQNISHTLHIWPGEAHKPRFWREMLRRYF